VHLFGALEAHTSPADDAVFLQWSRLSADSDPLVEAEAFGGREDYLLLVEHGRFSLLFLEAILI